MKEKIFWIDFTRIVAAFSVVFLHSAWFFIIKKSLPLLSWDVANVYSSSARMCVPVFFMISGYLLLKKDEPIIYFYKKRMFKILFPFVFWSCVYLLWKDHKGIQDFTFFSIITIIGKPAYMHLWFMYPLIGLYLIAPLLGKFVKDAENKHLLCFIIIWFINVAIIATLRNIYGFRIAIPIEMASGYAGYFILGLFIGRTEVSIKRAGTAFAVYVAFVAATAFLTHYYTIKTASLFRHFYDWRSPTVIISSAAAFLCIKWAGTQLAQSKSSFIKRIVIAGSSCTFGIYLLHFLVLEIIHNHFKSNLDGCLEIGVYIPVLTIAGFLLTLIIVMVLKQIPILRHSVP